MPRRPNFISTLAATLCALALAIPAAFADLSIIVHPDNPQSSLTQDELRSIFLGRLAQFPASSEVIVPLDLPPSDPAFSQFYQQVTQLEGTRLKRYRAYYLFSGRGKLPRTTASAADMLDAVANNPRAIGYLDSQLVNDQVKVLLWLRE